uniref:Uncharacterized protein n=1 Tax=Oryza rufipogon TaxID=4529 RepID=A0A0E0PIA4_ORYRU
MEEKTDELAVHNYPQMDMETTLMFERNRRVFQNQEKTIPQIQDEIKLWSMGQGLHADDHDELGDASCTRGTEGWLTCLDT